MTSNQKTNSRLDYGLVMILILLFLASCVAIYSAQTTGQYGSENFLIKQIIWYVIGAGIIAAVITLDSDQLQKLSWYAYGFGLVLLAGLIVAPSTIAPVINGAKSWYRVPAMGTLQLPS
ncbi:cell division protein FtsW [Mesobacillus boroniphilus JCM 21738]|uniref:Cell division protein FtsW n=1 Tax=Mesobacillus boroniphilus JCM 21738 TaxID=1294265 RepID=W4RT03_9BACI|nr:cell division protein FtsW [Mesobacillus boroniphilus JCM 21738]